MGNGRGHAFEAGMDTIRNDMTYALRSLWRSPGLTAAAVLCLGLGIGATTTIYSALRAIVLRPVPVADSDRVVRVSELPPNSPKGTDGTSPATFLDWKDNIPALGEVAGIQYSLVNVTGANEPERVNGSQVTPNFFSIVSNRALLGRTFIEADAQPGANPVVLLTYGLWQRRFGSDRNVIGRRVLLDGVSHEVIGVMPRDFVFPPGAELFQPLRFSGAALQDRRSNRISVIARLAPGATVQQARAQVIAAHQRIVRDHIQHRRDWTAVVDPVQQFYGSNPRPYMIVSMLSVTFVLLIGCANVANLLLARATGRGRELAVRLALGASRMRIVRLLLTESLVLALTGGVLGVLIALWGVLLLRNSIPAELVKFNPGWTQIGVNAASLLFALGASVLSSVVFGVLPAYHATRENLQGTLRDNARGSAGNRLRSRTRNALVVVEIALALVMVVGTGLTLKSFRALLAADRGFNREQVLTMQLALPGAKYDTPEKRAQFYELLNERLSALPSVTSAGLVTVLPMDWNDAATRLTDDTRPEAAEGDQPVVRTRTISASYFDVLQIPIQQGRSFNNADRINSAPVVLVSDQLARSAWPNRNPLGRRIRLLGDTTWREVVGVVGNTRHNPNTGPALQPTLYLPVLQRPAGWTSVVLRTEGDPLAVASAAQKEIAALDPALAAGDVRTLDRVIFNALAPQRATAGMLGVFAVIALILACVGVYGVMSYSVAARASELGVRLALGAQRDDVLSLVLRHGGTLTGLGIGVGLVGAWFMSRAMRALMFDAASTDLWAFAGGTLFLATMSLLACYVPARRAARTDPTLLLRQE